MLIRSLLLRHLFFFFNDTATTEIYTLSLHDALPIYTVTTTSTRSSSCTSSRTSCARSGTVVRSDAPGGDPWRWQGRSDRKSTRLNSSHLVISYAVFCLKKKK